MAKFAVKKNLQIAIDGPVAAGKGTIASLIAKKLGILYVYTGAMYRAVGYLAKINNIDYKDEEEILAILKRTKISLKPANKRGRFCRVFLNGKEVTDELFTQDASWAASVVATLPKIREELVSQQKKIAQHQSVIMEGRDITTKVLPNADLKIFMTATVLERAKRRFKQLRKEGVKINLKTVIEETKKRDYQDSHRQVDPLRVAPDALFLDTTRLTIKEVVTIVLEKLKEKGLVKELS